MTIGRYVRSTGSALADAGKEEWKRTQTLPGILSYAILPAEARAIHAAARVTVVGIRGVYRGAKSARAEGRANVPVVVEEVARPIHVESVVVEPIIRPESSRRYRRATGTDNA